jgi:sirohydrochlorin ferrochelatase
MTPRLLVVGHGTASREGSATTAGLVRRIRAARPGVRVDLCFLDVAAPRLSAALDDSPTVLVPLLLSTGYHVQADIPATVAPRSNVRVGRHLGPHPLLIDALVDRLQPAPGATPVLVGAPSSRPEAAAELAEAGKALGERLDQDVPVLTITRSLRPALAAILGPAQIATYLLAEGQFLQTLRAAADGLARVAAPLGEHQAIVDLVWLRYDQARVTEPA